MSARYITVSHHFGVREQHAGSAHQLLQRLDLELIPLLILLGVVSSHADPDAVQVRVVGETVSTDRTHRPALHELAFGFDEEVIPEAGEAPLFVPPVDV